MTLHARLFQGFPALWMAASAGCFLHVLLGAPKLRRAHAIVRPEAAARTERKRVWQTKS
jgi:hypothetical protein